MNEISIRLDSHRSPTGALSISDTYYAGELVANSNQAVTVPATAGVVAFSANGNFYVSYDGTTAAIPTGAIVASNVDLNPSTRKLEGITTLNIIAPMNTKITLAFYK